MFRRRNLNREEPLSRSTFIPRTNIRDENPQSDSPSNLRLLSGRLVSLTIYLTLFVLVRDLVVSACSLYSFHRPTSPVPPFCSGLGHLCPASQSNELAYRIPMIESRLSTLEYNVPFKQDNVITPSVNHASAAYGAQVLSPFTTPRKNPGWKSTIRKSLMRSPNSMAKSSPASVLNERLGPGDCWEFSGSQGRLGLSLSLNTSISAFSLDYPHPDSALAASIGKAPRAVVLWALFPSTTLLKEPSRPITYFLHTTSLPPNMHMTDRFFALYNGTFNPTLLPTRQYFPLTPPTGAMTQTIVLEVLSNWGSSSTCVYYVGVH